MKIIDVHAHLGDVLFGNELAEPYERTPWTPGWILEATGYRASRPPPGMKRVSRYLAVIHNQERNNMATLENLIKYSLPYGITTSVVLPIEPVRLTSDNLAAIAEYKSAWRMKLSSSFTVDKIARECGPGEAASELCENSEPPLCVRTFCSVHPKDPDKERKLGEFDRAGCLGLKLHPIIQNLAPEDPAWAEVFEIWAPTGKPILMHAGISGYYMPRSVRDGYGEGARYERLIAAFPRIPVVLAHMNMQNYEVVWELAGKYDNVFADASFHSAAKIRQARAKMGAERLLFASDFPFSLPKYSVKAGMEATDDDPVFRERFFHDNAARLLGIND